MRIKVAIIDSGINIDYKEFESIKIDGINLINNKNEVKDIIDQNGHGTSCAGEIVYSNRSVSFHIVKIYESLLNSTLDKLIEALEYVESVANVNIINISSSVRDASTPNAAGLRRLNSVLQKLHAKNILVVCSASNANNLGFPATLERVLGVKSKVDRSKRLVYNPIEVIECTCHCEYRFMPTLNQRYEFFIGNSAAAPKVVAHISNMMLANNTTDIKDIKMLMKDHKRFKRNINKLESGIQFDKAILQLVLAKLRERKIDVDWMTTSLRVIERYECFDLVKDLKNILKLEMDYRDLCTFDFENIFSLSARLTEIWKGN